MKSIAVLAVAGLASVAAAQNISTDLVVSLTYDKTSIGIGETATATIIASWNGVVGSYFSSFNVNLNASGEYVSVSNLAGVAWNNTALGFDGTGTISGASILNFQAAQFSLIPPFVSTNPILVTTFTVTGIAPGYLTYSTTNADGAPFPMSVTGPIFSDPVVEFGNDAFAPNGIWVAFPAPSSVALLGLGGLAAGRRRR